MAEILLYGIIGDATDKLDANSVTTSIRAASGPLSLRINSAGGYVMEGLAIIAALRAYQGRITVYIDGLAASMASVIAMMGDEIIIAETAQLMIHNPWDVAVGDAPELRRAADKLDQIRNQLVTIYAKRTGLPEGELIGLMDAETWFTAEQALAKGFVTSIADSLRIAALADIVPFGFRHPPSKLLTQEPIMPEHNDITTAVAAERTRISTIMALCDKHRIKPSFGNDLVSRGLPLDQARAAILDHLATEGDRMNIGHGNPSLHGGQTLDNPEFRSKAMSDALSARMQNKAAEGAAVEYRGMTLANMARDHLSRAGISDAYQMSDERVFKMAFQGGSAGGGAMAYHTSSDFPAIIQAGIETTLLDQYRVQISPLKALTSPRFVADFKPQTVLRVAGFGTLDQVNEHGEFKNKSMAEATETFRVGTFGNMIGFTRQMLINDSFGALADFTQQAARAAANVEGDVLAAMINSNPPMADGKSWFSADHANIADSGSAPSIASLDTGRQAMRGQKNLDGTLIDARPKFLLVPTTLETSVETLVTATIAPGTTTDPNPFAGKLTVVAEPRLISATAWYLFADPAFAPAFLSVYLEGQQAPYVGTEDGWRIDGTEIKIRHDFGAGIVDSKMAWKNPGA